MLTFEKRIRALELIKRIAERGKSQVMMVDQSLFDDKDYMKALSSDITDPLPEIKGIVYFETEDEK